MKNELSVKVGESEIKCILLDGFYSATAPTNNLHRHNYTEVHIILGERVSFELENQILELSGCSVLAIPSGLLHRFTDSFTGVRHSAFLTEFPLAEFMSRKLSDATALAFFDEIALCAETGDYTKVAAYISILCSDIFKTEALRATPITDHAFIINNFFSMNYNKDVTLADLAEYLHYSEKQTARLIKKHTGLTFKQAMVDYRMAIARHLSKTTDLTLAEIAQRVGYHSYNGFWQAYRQNQK